ncbi:hypothetical protein [uncultured Mediterranean phage uvMED]|jgi:hypothetical protein|nr:hypothetical protein [uncultured Mediterranean phage uvMED]
MKEEYTNKEINQAILHLKNKGLAHVEYVYFYREVIGVDTGDKILYDHASCSHVSVKEVISSALESGWEND